MLVVVMVFAALLLGALGAAGWLVAVYNRLVAGRNETAAAWANIDVELRRRTDLVPNLVEVVRGYAAHERSTLQAVVDARTAVQNASGVSESAAADRQLSSAFAGLFAVAEAYPELAANDTFVMLQRELAATETRVAHVRSGYNDRVRAYNTAVGSFPAVLVAGPLGFAAAEYFEDDDPAIRTAPTVEF